MWKFLFSKILLRLLAALPMYFAFKTQQFEVLAVSSFILAVIGPWEIWQYLRERGFRGFGIDIAGSMIKEVDAKQGVIEKQEEMISNLNSQIDQVMSQYKENRDELSRRQEQYKKLIAENKIISDELAKSKNIEIAAKKEVKSVLDQLVLSNSGSSIHSAKAASAFDDFLKGRRK